MEQKSKLHITLHNYLKSVNVVNTKGSNAKTSLNSVNQAFRVFLNAYQDNFS